MKELGICAVAYCNDEVVRDARFCSRHLNDWYCLRLQANPDGTFSGTSRPEPRPASQPEWLRRGVAKALDVSGRAA